MKVVVIKASAGFKPGDVRDNIETADLGQLVQEGIAVPFEEFERNKKLLVQAVDRAKARGAVAPKDELVLAGSMDRLNNGAPVDLITELLDSKPGQSTVTATGRVTGYQKETGHVERVRASAPDAVKGYLEARKPMDALIRAGDIKEATRLSVQASNIAANEILSFGEGLYLPDVVRAVTDVTDPDTQLGTLSTGLILMKNLGYLTAKLAWLPYLTTDLRNEPAQFLQSVLTRYITPPDVLTFVPGIGYTSDAATIAAYIASGRATQTSGTKTSSVISTTDVPVVIDQQKACEIVISNQRIGATVRNLHTEQQSGMLYSLAKEINKFVLGKLFSTQWTGIKTSFVKSVANFDIKAMVGIKNAMTIAQIPDMGRFCLLHSFLYDKLLEDSNLLNAKAILALLNKDESSFNTGEIPALFGVRPLETQLASATAAGVLTDWIDSADLGTTASYGFAGNAASMVFAARVPQDYNALAQSMGVPATASFEVITEPNSGLSMLFARYVDHGKEAVITRGALMYGAAPGDKRVGLVIKAAA